MGRRRPAGADHPSVVVREVRQGHVLRSDRCADQDPGRQSSLTDGRPRWVLEVARRKVKIGVRDPDPTGDLDGYSRSYDDIRCVIMQGGQGEVKHWAFNDPLPRTGAFT